jgi:dTDP-4-dehydrorhamnose 3,5-epimerase
MEIEKTKIEGLLIIKNKHFIDERGFFMEILKESTYIKELNLKFKQINMSVSKKNVLRGLHFQTGEKAQGKLICVTKGEVFDVVVDVRKNSPTYKQWLSFDLTENDEKQIYIPVGCAHGFLSKKDDTIFLYACTEEYSPGNEFGIRYDDPELKIQWPKIDNEEYIISKKDLLLPYLKKDD